MSAIIGDLFARIGNIGKGLLETPKGLPESDISAAKTGVPGNIISDTPPTPQGYRYPSLSRFPVKTVAVTSTASVLSLSTALTATNPGFQNTVQDVNKTNAGAVLSL